jgi:hypothetical protein
LPKYIIEVIYLEKAKQPIIKTKGVYTNEYIKMLTVLSYLALDINPFASVLNVEAP